MSPFGWVYTRLKWLLRCLADFVFPPVCYGCDAEIESGLICDSCRLLLYTSELDVCSRCGRPCLPDDRLCGNCAPPLALSRIRALGLYAPPFRGLIHALKYQEKTALVPVLGGALALLVHQDIRLRQADGICAVPLHPARQRERGYNQAHLLAWEVARITGIPLVEPLARIRNTKSQTDQPNERARVENVRAAFRLKPGENVEGKRLILVDDVMTTGATLSSAAEELRKGGAVEVMGLVVAAAVSSKERSGCRGTPGMRAGTRVSAPRPGAG